MIDLKIPFFLFFICLAHFSCERPSASKTYLYIGHAYQWGVEEDNRVDFRIEKLDLKKYDQIWLGGDLCARTTSDPKTLDYLDELFDLSNPDHHWSLGNHDVLQGNLQYIQNKTRRPSFYSRHFDKITLAVLNTNFNHPQVPNEGDDCAEMEQQFQMLQNICDTISTSSHLMLLHHHNLLTNTIARNSLEIDTIFHFNRPTLSIRCNSDKTFENTIYPMLETVQQKGIQVILVAGDVGQRVKEFEYKSPEGIIFLGSGINNSVEKEWAPEWVRNFNPDKLLLFHHDMKTHSLSWEFKELNKLLENDD